MPNHVTHKLTFDAHHAEKIFADLCPGGNLDFNALIPQPPQMYHGDLSAADEKDFRCNWYNWNSENWGTKWGAYNGTAAIEGDKAVILFQTAWNIPYPAITAFANRLCAEFEHRYFDEAPNFWGVETWKMYQGKMYRANKRYCDEKDRVLLSIELTGYDPTSPDKDDDE